MTTELYIATNKNNGNCYVGVSKKGMAKRRRDHLASAARGIRGRFYDAIRKHGPDAFLFRLVAVFDVHDEALDSERRLIAEIKPAYNITDGGQGALGYRHSPEVLEKMRARATGRPGYWKGKKRSPETIEKIRATKKDQEPTRYWLGKKRDPETVAKIAKARKGKPSTCKPSPEVKEIWAENMRRAARARRKPVLCLTDGRMFESARAASVAYGFSYASVAAVCNRSRGRTAVYGLHFMYVGGDANGS